MNHEIEKTTVLSRLEAIQYFGVHYRLDRVHYKIIEVLGSHENAESCYHNLEDAISVLQEEQYVLSKQSFDKLNNEMKKFGIRIKLFFARNFKKLRGSQVGLLSSAAILEDNLKFHSSFLRDYIPPHVELIPDQICISGFMPKTSVVVLVHFKRFPFAPLLIWRDNIMNYTLSYENERYFINHHMAGDGRYLKYRDGFLYDEEHDVYGFSSLAIAEEFFNNIDKKSHSDISDASNKLSSFLSPSLHQDSVIPLHGDNHLEPSKDVIPIEGNEKKEDFNDLMHLQPCDKFSDTANQDRFDNVIEHGVKQSVIVEEPVQMEVIHRIWSIDDVPEILRSEHEKVELSPLKIRDYSPIYVEESKIIDSILDKLK